MAHSHGRCHELLNFITHIKSYAYEKDTLKTCDSFTKTLEGRTAQKEKT